ncbi:hypothetical protein AC579_2847 [Pseudocercospora musae]|uniref:Uncharacterized protein n=1 Tax=Pseudocercospora musae TaxID=113226 RepID=A0A139I4I1_9PEZI|nr:hypothetical protein AC579_2847 [Pseudocercospora musae]
MIDDLANRVAVRGREATSTMDGLRVPFLGPVEIMQGSHAASSTLRAQCILIELPAQSYDAADLLSFLELPVWRKTVDGSLIEWLDVQRPDIDPRTRHSKRDYRLFLPETKSGRPLVGEYGGAGSSTL